MGFRYSRRIRICKGIHLNVSKSGVGISLGTRGASVSMGPRGTYVNTVLPGTGLSIRQKIDNASSNDKVLSENEIRKANYVTGSDLKIQIDNDGKELVYMEAPDGSTFIDEAMLRRIKRSEQYKQMLETTRKAKYEDMKQKNDGCVEIYKSTPKIVTEEDVIAEKNNTFEVKRKYYRVKTFDLSHPDESALYDEAHSWALNNVKNAKFWNRKRIIEDTTLNKLQELFEVAKNEWISKKDSFLAQEKINKEKIDKQFEDEYKQQIEERNKLYDLILNPDDKYLTDTISDVLSQIKLPVDFSIDFSVSDRKIELDLDLPEIEDFPQVTCSILSSGKLSVKKKSVSDLNKDYATGVVGLAFFFAGLVFNVSPKIETISISGYTQRVSKKSGNIEDQYVYTVKFDRDGFSKLNIQNIDPLQAITNFEHLIDITSKYELKTISKKVPPKQKSENLSGTDTDAKDAVVEKSTQKTAEPETSDFSYTQQYVVDNYDSSFECTLTSKEALAAISRKRKESVQNKIMWAVILLLVMGTGSLVTFLIHRNYKFNNEFNDIISSVKSTYYVANRVHSDSVYYYLSSANAEELDDKFYSLIYALCEKKNPVVLILNKRDDSIIDFIDSYFYRRTAIPENSIVECGDALAIVYNLNKTQDLLTYPLKELDLYKIALEEKQKQDEIAAKEAAERAARYMKIRSENYIYTYTVPRIYHEKINPNKRIKNNTRSKDIQVTYIFAYCPENQDPKQLIEDIRNMETNPYLSISVYSKKYTVAELKKGVDTHYRIAKWTFDGQ